KMAVNVYGKGRSFYITGLPYSFENARILYKALCWTAGKELKVCYSSDTNTECNYYPETGRYAVINNANIPVNTDFYDIDGKKQRISLKPMEIQWKKK
ncbi:MAG: 1,3-beta-galactosyl-N-acetylhexosamine phosphorylase, partial [Clostridia bacterium]|nr:1,3-beta-galactosyl-N-acetylhexosamine phosphorylase [Clostridia bacterium]